MTQRHINLTVPTGWNQCSAAQLEQIAQILLVRKAMQDRYHPYDPLQFKIECFFALAGLEMVGQTSDDDGFIVRRKPAHRSQFYCLRQMADVFSSRKEEQFRLQAWQVHGIVDQHLKWLDDFNGLWLFPYDRFGYDFGRWTVGWWRPSWMPLPLPFPMPQPLKGPAPLLDGMSWQQYRLANEWLTVYIDQTNSLESAKTGEEKAGIVASVQESRDGFLKALFGCADLSYCPRRLRRMRQDQFQLCLIWWQSMMKEMQRKYKRCFKQTATAKGQQMTLPIDIYTRSMATFQENYHMTEEQINQQPCRVLLQHLEDMAYKAEELEKINRSHK